MWDLLGWIRNIFYFKKHFGTQFVLKIHQNKGEENTQLTTKRHLNNFSFFFKWITTWKKNSKFKILQKW